MAESIKIMFMWSMIPHRLVDGVPLFQRNLWPPSSQFLKRILSTKVSGTYTRRLSSLKLNFLTLIAAICNTKGAASTGNLMTVSWFNHFKPWCSNLYCLLEHLELFTLGHQVCLCVSYVFGTNGNYFPHQHC
jgi:hypothetical protein